MADLNEFPYQATRTINPSIRHNLDSVTVPLAATAISRHVLVSTTYSKSVLRVAAETVCGARQRRIFPVI